MIQILLMFCLLALSMYCVKLCIGRSFQWQELGVAVGAIFMVLIIGYAVSMSSNMDDIEVWSGKVVSKTREEVSCRHSYECNCHEECEGSGKDRECSEECETCYEHDYDVDWDVHTTIGTFSVDTLDSQGLKQPPRWTQVQKDDPVSKTMSYQNYIQAVPGSLYHRSLNKNFSIPKYPLEIFDYYKINRVVDADMGADANVVKKMNEQISLDLRDVAHAKQVNLVIVLTKNPDQMYAQNLKDAWLGGKKNDLVLVIGSTDGGKTIAWDDVFSWSNVDLVNTTIRDDIAEHSSIDAAAVDIAINDINQYWSRKPMSDYAYLKKEIRPSTKAYFIIFFLGLFASIISVVIIEAINKQDSSFTRFNRPRNF